MMFYGNWAQDGEKALNITESLKSYYFKDQDIGPKTPNALVDVGSIIFLF